jgi:hypothetical protein
LTPGYPTASDGSRAVVVAIILGLVALLGLGGIGVGFLLWTQQQTTRTQRSQEGQAAVPPDPRPAQPTREPGAYPAATRDSPDTPTGAGEFVPRSFIVGSFTDSGFEDAKFQASKSRSQGFPVQLRRAVGRGYYVICGPYLDEGALADAMQRDRELNPTVQPIPLTRKIGPNIPF